MDITIKGEPKEIAALVLAAQERQGCEAKSQQQIKDALAEFVIRIAGDGWRHASEIQALPEVAKILIGG